MSFYNFNKFVSISMKNNLPNQQQLNANNFVFKSNTTEFKFQMVQLFLFSFLCSASPSAVSQASTKPIEKKQWLGEVKIVDYTQLTN